MKEIIEYIVVRDDEEKLAEQVNEKIQEGWQPLGGISHTIDCLECQAMVKYGGANLSFQNLGETGPG